MSRLLELANELVELLKEQESAPAEAKEEPVIDQYQLAVLRPGDVFKIGEHDFIVLEQMDGQTAVISKDFMAEEVEFDDETRDYNKSSIKKLLDDEILKEIEAAVGADNIVEHEVDLTSVDMQNEFGTCTCKVRLITFDEARKDNDLLVTEDIGDYWWTCTPWSTEARGWKYSMTVVYPSGRVYRSGCVNYYGVRPFCILKSNIFVSKED